MAIAVDATSTSNTASVSHTCTGSNRFLMVGIYTTNGGSSNDADYVSAVTYNSVAMTRSDTGINTSNYRLYTYYLINPSTGANTISVTSGSSSTRIRAVSYTGAKQSSQPDATSPISNGSGTDTMTLTVVANNSWQVGMVSGGSLVAGTGATQRTSDGSQGLFDSNGPLAAGSQSMTVTGSGGIYGLGMSIAPNPITISLTESMSMTEVLSFVRKIIISLTETISILSIYLFSLSDSMTGTDVIQALRKAWKSQSKNSGSWTSQNKS